MIQGDLSHILHNIQYIFYMVSTFRCSWALIIPKDMVTHPIYPQLTISVLHQALPSYLMCPVYRVSAPYRGSCSLHYLINYVCEIQLCNFKLVGSREKTVCAFCIRKLQSCLIQYAQTENVVFLHGNIDYLCMIGSIQYNCSFGFRSKQTASVKVLLSG